MQKTGSGTKPLDVWAVSASPHKIFGREQTGASGTPEKVPSGASIKQLQFLPVPMYPCHSSPSAWGWGTGVTSVAKHSHMQTELINLF